MPNPRIRSLNLAVSVGIVLFEALRQTGGLQRDYSEPHLVSS